LRRKRLGAEGCCRGREAIQAQAVIGSRENVTGAGRFVPELAQEQAAAVAEDVAVRDHVSALPLAGGSYRLDSLDVEGLAVASEPQVITGVASLGGPGADENRNGYGLVLELVPGVVQALFHVLFRELDLYGFHLGNAELVELFNLDQDNVIGELVLADSALVGVIAVAQAEQYERHSNYLTGA